MKYFLFSQLTQLNSSITNRDTERHIEVRYRSTISGSTSLFQQQFLNTNPRSNHLSIAKPNKSAIFATVDFFIFASVNHILRRKVAMLRSVTLFGRVAKPILVRYLELFLEWFTPYVPSQYNVYCYYFWTESRLTKKPENSTLEPCIFFISTLW